MTEEAKVKPDVILSKGQEIFFDLDKISYGEVLGMVDPNESPARSDQTIAKAAGISFDDVKAMTGKDYKKFVRAFWDKWREPLNDPND